MSNGNQRTAVVIGGASGIGWATAQALAVEGDRVTIADRMPTGLRPGPPNSVIRTPRRTST